MNKKPTEGVNTPINRNAYSDHQNIKQVGINKADANPIDADGILNIPTTEGITLRYSLPYYIITETKDIQTPDRELKALGTLDHLKTKLEALDHHIEKARTTKDEDTFILLGKKIAKAKDTINKYLNQLKEDKNFTLMRTNQDLTLSYMGQFVTAYKKLTIANLPEGVNV